jgi:outer membrane immunogenic protein
MTKLLLIGAAFAALIAGPAMAADLGAPVYRRPVAVAAPIYTWTGFYVGGNVGYSWGRPNSDTILTGIGAPTTFGPFAFGHSDPLKLDGVIGGAQIGYNWQASTNWVYGLEADWQASSEKAGLSYSDPYAGTRIGFEAAGAANTNYDAKISWFGTVRGRIGYAWDRLLIYGTGGLAFGRVKLGGAMADSGSTLVLCFPCGPTPFGGTAPFSTSRVNAGWTAGIGVEGALVGRWTWKAEYLYVDLGTFNLFAAGPFATETISLHARFTDNIVRVGLNYKFGYAPVPIVTK